MTRIRLEQLRLGLARIAATLRARLDALASDFRERLPGWRRRLHELTVRGKGQALDLRDRLLASKGWAIAKQAYAEASERLDKAFAAKEPTPRDFLPGILKLQEAPPSPLGRTVLRVLLGLLGLLLVWSIFGSLDIVAVAEGKLVPQSFLQIAQTSESGIVKEILVREGQHVASGQVLMRMDAVASGADVKSLEAEVRRKALTIRRVDAELDQTEFRAQPGDLPDLFREIEARAAANRSALETALAEERSRLAKARTELSAARETRIKLSETLPQYKAQEEAHARLAREGFAPALTAGDKRRERIEKEQELRTQTHLVSSASASVQQSERKCEQLLSEYRKNLHAERAEAQGQLDKLQQELAKQEHRFGLLEIKAPNAGIVKDLSTHTIGTVTQPGTVLLTLVPDEEKVRAEVWVSNQDRGFVRQGQRVRLKFAAFPFQKYGMLDGTVEYVSADASDPNSGGGGGQPNAQKGVQNQPLSFRALVTLEAMHLDFDGQKLPLGSGLQTSAEILIGQRSVLEYLLSPVRKAVHEAGRER